MAKRLLMDGIFHPSKGALPSHSGCRKDSAGKFRPDIMLPGAIASVQTETWAQHWRERAPQAVATLERDFEQTLVYYSLPSVTRQWIRFDLWNLNP